MWLAFMGFVLYSDSFHEKISQVHEVINAKWSISVKRGRLSSHLISSHSMLATEGVKDFCLYYSACVVSQKHLVGHCGNRMVIFA